MVRFFALILGLLLLVARPAASAEPAPASASPASASIAPAVPAITPEQARAALEVLNDPQKRAAFAATLKVIAQGQSAPVPPTPVSVVAAGPLEPDSLGAQVLVKGTSFLSRASDRLLEALAAVQSVPLLWGWLYAMVNNPVGQEVLLGVGWRLALAVLCGLGAAVTVTWLLRGTRARLRARALALTAPPMTAEDRAERGDIEGADVTEGGILAALQQFWLTLARYGITLVPLLGLWVVGHIVAAIARGGPADAPLVIAAVLWAMTLVQALKQAVSVILEPDCPRLRLVPLEDAPAGQLTQSAGRLIVVSVCCYAFAEVGLLLGLSELAHSALLRMAGLFVTGWLAVLIIRQRRPVGAVLRVPETARGVTAAIRNGLAPVWHWIALAGLAGLWLIWAADSIMSAAALGRLAMLTVLVLAADRLALMVLLGFTDRLLPREAPAGEQVQGIGGRLRSYHPIMRAGWRAVVHGLAVILLMQVYGAGTLTWLLSTSAGQRVLSSLLTLAVTVLAAVLVWELANAAIQRHLAELVKDARLAQSSRLRTLLPVLRTALLVTISIVSSLMILSELGVNIGPLLAGAGILGVAIGFGSQKLVQDLITGLFLLLENALQIGDLVNVSGLTGTVEGLSVRTITLRALDGAIHIIPFSAVTSVTNHNRGLGNAEVRVMVDYEADTDRVADVLRAIVTEMRAEPAYADKIMKDFQLFGVDRIDLNGVTITGQVACTDSGRWTVQREINRRIRLRFEEQGILFFNQVRPPAAV